MKKIHEDSLFPSSGTCVLHLLPRYLPPHHLTCCHTALYFPPVPVCALIFTCDSLFNPQDAGSQFLKTYHKFLPNSPCQIPQDNIVTVAVYVSTSKATQPGEFFLYIDVSQPTIYHHPLHCSYTFKLGQFS